MAHRRVLTGPIQRRDTLGVMETPGSAPSGEVEAATWVAGKVMPPGSDLPESDPPGAGDAQAPSGPVWPFLFKPRWLAWHLLVALAFCGMLWLGDWQLHRATGGNGLSWAYTFEWPLFAVFAVVFWARTIRDEFLLRRGVLAEDNLVARVELAKLIASLPEGAMLPAGTLPEGVSIRQLTQSAYDDADDPELARYNARLAKLNAKDRRKALGAG
jgi:hypothetical protein